MQVDEPLQLYNHPLNMFVAGFIGSPPMNFMHGSLQREGGRTLFVEKNEKGTPLVLHLPDPLAARGTSHIGKPVVFGIRPEDIADSINVSQVVAGASGPARVEVSEPMGAETYLYLETGAHSFIAKVRSGDRYPIGQQLTVCFDLEKGHLFDPETENVLR
jgi:multiple sugar transport system ATP-binding protein